MSEGGDCGCGNADSEEIRFETAPFDPRFPNTNQTKHCYISFIDYHRCIKAKGECDKRCEYYQRVYRSMCPNEWVKKWQEQMENGTFAGQHLIGKKKK